MKETYCTAHLRSISDTLELIGGKWKLLIMTLLFSESPMRFSEIQRALGTITPRMLSKELKELELNELIERRVYPTMPVSVDYRLTDYGRSLDSVMVALGDWGKQHRKRIMHPAKEEAVPA
ncbi:putative HTH-type transcriptional regulator BH0655 [Fibrisoma limi BUZ 3]|uniref:Putative HTH-type transcriptional regulator BH0655 n=1 Tax=Fibrisoma limi BUZ 3 TaxID=1185876 RepID=I2GC64_9BACT|nr:helix-turn-helix domain-containing protein [Fibrisoma limi]CCH51488.1 putative HTH-type transcriptional regulator BH0655 [Fibrisoma limi BUZ 3]